MAKKKYKSYLIVDGYNIINAWDGLKEISKEDLESAREKLIHYIIEYAQYTGKKAIIVFDAYNVKNSKEKIAIIITGWSKYFGSDKYFYENPYLSDELTELIIEKNFKGIAIDTCSVDKYGKDTNHKKLLENNVWIVENISNCDNLNKTSYSSFFIPLNIEAEASPVRAFLKKD